MGCSGAKPYRAGAAKGNRPGPAIQAANGYALQDFVRDMLLPVEGYCFRLPDEGMDSRDDALERVERVNSQVNHTLYKQHTLGKLRSTRTISNLMRRTGVRGGDSEEKDRSNAICRFKLTASTVVSQCSPIMNLIEDDVDLEVRLDGLLQGIPPKESDKSEEDDMYDDDESTTAEEFFDSLGAGNSPRLEIERATSTSSLWRSERSSMTSVATWASTRRQEPATPSSKEPAEQSDLEFLEQQEANTDEWELAVQVHGVLKVIPNDGSASRRSSIYGASLTGSPGMSLTVCCHRLEVRTQKDKGGDPCFESWLPTQDILRNIEVALNARLQLSLRGIPGP